MPTDTPEPQPDRHASATAALGTVGPARNRLSAAMLVSNVSTCLIGGEGCDDGPRAASRAAAGLERVPSRWKWLCLTTFC